MSSAISSISAGSSFHEKPDDAMTLNIMSLPVYGRENETMILREAFHRVSESEGNSEVVLLRGGVGCGKSTLIENGLRNFVSQSGFYIEGKFDEKRMKEPYGAIVHAFTDLCDLLTQSPILRKVQDNLSSMFNDNDLSVMKQLISNLKYILPASRASTNYNNQDTGMGSTMRLERLCKLFLKAVSTASHPIALFLDDLQFADAASLDVLKALAQDLDSRHVLFIYSFHRDFFFKYDVSSSLTTANLTIDDLSVHAIDDIVAHLTAIPKGARTMELAETIHTKTHGNAQHVLRFLEACHSEQLLTFSAEKVHFTWDITRIRSETSISANVVELVARKVSRLHPHVKSVLQVAAYLGFHFDVPVLSKLVQLELGDAIFNRLAKILEAGIKEGVIEPATPIGRYKFSHDRMQAVLYEMLPDGRERELLHMRIGFLILEYFKQDFHIFLAVDHLGRGQRYIDDFNQIKVAELGLQAGKLAFRKSAFLLAEENLQFGISNLPIDCWTSHYDISLELHSTLAEIGECTGNFVQSTKVVESILNNATNLKDKFRAYHSIFDQCRAEGKFQDAINMSKLILSHLGHPFPKSPSKAMVATELLKVKLVLRGFSTDDLFNLPMTLNSSHIEKIRLLNILATSAYFANKSEVFTLACLRMVRMSIKKGLSKYSAYCFGCFAVLQVFLDNHDQAYRYAMLALKLLVKLKSRMVEVQVHSMCYHLVMHWKVRTIVEIYLVLFCKECSCSRPFSQIDTETLSRVHRGANQDTYSRDGNGGP